MYIILTQYEPLRPHLCQRLGILLLFCVCVCLDRGLIKLSFLSRKFVGAAVF